MIARTSSSAGGATALPASPARSSRKIQGRALGRASDHHAIGAALFQRTQCLGRTIDVAIDENRQADGALDGRGRFVFGRAREEIGTRASVHGEAGDARVLGDARDRDGVAAVAVPARAHLERDRNAGRRDHRGEDARDESLVAHEGRTGCAVAHLLRRAAEVDVDDLRAELDIHARGVGHHAGVIARDLHDARLGLAAMVEPVARLRRVPQAEVRSHHLGGRDSRPHAAAQPAKRQVGHARHRRERERRRNLVRTDFHGPAVLIWLAQRTPPFAGRQMSSSNPTASDPGSTMRMSASARSPGPRSPPSPAPGR